MALQAPEGLLEAGIFEEQMIRRQVPSVRARLEFLQAKSRELDISSEVDAAKGVNIILLEDEIPHETAIYLDLVDVPMSEALRYVTELGQCSYRVRADGVRVMHRHTVADQLHTRSYRVPRDFLSIGGAPAEPAHVDPFAPSSGKDVRKNAKTARQILESHSIPFPEGASAFFSTSTGMLLVRNTQPNLDIVEAFVDTRCVRYSIPVGITAQVLQAPGPLLRRMAAKAAPLNDHRALLEELLAAVKAGTVEHLDTARIETKSGTRATAEQGHDLTGLSRLTLDGKGGTTMEHERLFSGLCLEAGFDLRQLPQAAAAQRRIGFHPSPSPRLQRQRRWSRALLRRRRHRSRAAGRQCGGAASEEPGLMDGEHHSHVMLTKSGSDAALFCRKQAWASCPAPGFPCRCNVHWLGNFPEAGHHGLPRCLSLAKTLLRPKHALPGAKFPRFPVYALTRGNFFPPMLPTSLDGHGGNACGHDDQACASFSIAVAFLSSGGHVGCQRAEGCVHVVDVRQTGQVNALTAQQFPALCPFVPGAGCAARQMPRDGVRKSPKAAGLARCGKRLTQRVGGPQ